MSNQRSVDRGRSFERLRACFAGDVEDTDQDCNESGRKSEVAVTVLGFCCWPCDPKRANGHVNDSAISPPYKPVERATDRCMEWRDRPRSADISPDFTPRLPLSQHRQTDGALNRHDCDADRQRPQSELKPTAFAFRLGFHRRIIVWHRQRGQVMLGRPVAGPSSPAASRLGLEPPARVSRARQTVWLSSDATVHLSSVKQLPRLADGHQRQGSTGTGNSGCSGSPNALTPPAAWRFSRLCRSGRPQIAVRLFYRQETSSGSL